MARRESFTLFKKADFEGSLEKVSSGIASKLMSGKSKIWCELYGPTLHIFKEMKKPGMIKQCIMTRHERSSSGSQQIDMRQAQFVRKSSCDKTGTLFEVFSKNKSYTFCAASPNDCSTWIRHLQNAMTLAGDDDAPPSSHYRKPSYGDYETVGLPDEDKPSGKLTIGMDDGSEAGYAEVQFPDTVPQTPSHNDGNLETPPESTSVRPQDSGYSVIEVKAKSGPGMSKPLPVPSPRAPLPKPPAPGGSRPRKEGDYDEVDVRPEPGSGQTVPSFPRTEADGSEEEDSYGYATVNHAAKSSAKAADPKAEDLAMEAPRLCGDGMVDDEEEDLLLSASLTPIPQYPHPLGPEDVEPLAALREFLSNNRKVCRRSFLNTTPAEDPVKDMKNFLQELCV